MATLPSNKALQPTPLRVEQDRGDFVGQKQRKYCPDLSVRRG
jgi:hypothetical protein